MLVIVDTNRVFSALLSKGKVFEIFLLNKSLKKIKFISPELLFNEISRNFREIVERSKLSSKELSRVFNLIKEQIELIPFEDFNGFVNEAKTLSPHEKDVKYFALALFNNCGIWSNEKKFRSQSKIKIFSDDELFKFLSS